MREAEADAVAARQARFVDETTGAIAWNLPGEIEESREERRRG